MKYIYILIVFNKVSFASTVVLKSDRMVYLARGQTVCIPCANEILFDKFQCVGLHISISHCVVPQPMSAAHTGEQGNRVEELIA